MKPLGRSLQIPCHCFIQQDTGVLEDFHHFISINAHLLVERPLPDLIQLALSEPADSEVYKQALEEATRRAGKGDLYLKWWYVLSLLDSVC